MTLATRKTLSLYLNISIATVIGLIVTKIDFHLWNLPKPVKLNTEVFEVLRAVRSPWTEHSGRQWCYIVFYVAMALNLFRILHSFIMAELSESFRTFDRIYRRSSEQYISKPVRRKVMGHAAAEMYAYQTTSQGIVPIAALLATMFIPPNLVLMFFASLAFILSLLAWDVPTLRAARWLDNGNSVRCPPLVRHTVENWVFLEVLILLGIVVLCVITTLVAVASDSARELIFGTNDTLRQAALWTTNAFLFVILVVDYFVLNRRFYFGPHKRDDLIELGWIARTRRRVLGFVASLGGVAKKMVAVIKRDETG